VALVTLVTRVTPFDGGEKYFIQIIIMKLYLVTGHGTQQGRSMIDIAQQAVAGGVEMVWLHERDMNDEQLAVVARELHERLRPAGVPMILMDHVEVAQAVDAEGVVIGCGGMQYAEARKIMGSEKIIGLSCNTIEQVKTANDIDVDFIAISPLFGGKDAFGLDGLKEAKRVSRHQVCAIGGIDASNIRDVRDAGADSAAVRSAIVEPANPMKAASVLRFLIDN